MMLKTKNSGDLVRTIQKTRKQPSYSPVRLGLTGRETEVLSWVSVGKTNTEIGEILSASPRTVQKHLEHIYKKLGVKTRTAAAFCALSIIPRRESE